MKSIITRMGVTGLLLLSGLAYASEEVTAKYQTCAACHGARGEGKVALNAPALAGQGAAYLERQLQHFKTGVRGSDPADSLGAQMKPLAALLSDEDIAQMAAYLSSLPLPAATVPESGDLRNGNNYYQSKCGACHGGTAQGNAALNSPRLAGLDSVYLKRQMQNFVAGIRGSHADDKYGRQMKMMASTLGSEKDLDDVVAFIQASSGE